MFAGVRYIDWGADIDWGGSRAGAWGADGGMSSGVAG